MFGGGSCLRGIRFRQRLPSNRSQISWPMSLRPQCVFVAPPYPPCDTSSESPHFDHSPTTQAPRKGGNTGAGGKLTNTNIVTTGWLRDCLEAAAHVSLPFAVRFVWDDRGKRCADTPTRCGSEVFELSCDPCECKVNVLETFLVGFSIKSTSTQKSTTAYVDAPPQT